MSLENLHRLSRTFAAIVVVALASDAGATVILDQTSGGPAGFTFTRCLGCSGSILDIAQTFTVGQAGALDRVEIHNVSLNLSSGGSTAGSDLLFDIRPTTGAGLPVQNDGLAMATISLPAASMPTGFFAGPLVFDLAPFGLSFGVGDVVSFVLRSNGNTFAFGTSAGNAYAGGQYTQRFFPGDPFPDFTAPSFPDGTDLSFSTFVAMPEPASLVLVGFGLAAIALRRRERSQREAR